MKSQNFILSFDIPKSQNTLRVRIFRMLKRIKAKKIHDSLWSSSDLNSLIEIAMRIKDFGGSASILEEKFIF